MLGVAAVVVVATVAAAVWLAHTAERARAELTAARAELGPLRAGVLAGDASVPARLAALQRHARAAREATHDPVWAAASWLPWLGEPVATVRGLTSAVDAVAVRSLPPIGDAMARVHPADLLSTGRLDVTALSAAAKPLGAAADSLRQARDDVGGLSPSWLSQVAEARAELHGQLVPLAALAESARTAAQVAPGMLGKDGARRYFVAFQNPAEARGTGGLLDAFAIVRADRGTLTVERTGTNADLPALPVDRVGLDRAFVARYGDRGAGELWVNANLSPDFPEVARAWMAMWRAGTRQQLDGVLALDPSALSAVLTATGPVSAPVVGAVGADTVVDLVLLDQYRRPDLAAQRKKLMLGVGVQAMQAVLGRRADARILLPALRDSAAAGHVLLYSRDRSEQAALVRSGVSGAVWDGSGPFAQAVVVNAAGSKLDTWLEQSLSYRVDTCTPTGRQVTVSVGLVNGAPRSGLPAYVTIRSDHPPGPSAPGQNRLDLQVLTTRGARLISAALDGRPVPPAPAPGKLPATLPAGGLNAGGLDSGFIAEHVTAGRPAFGIELELVPGRRRTLVLTLQEPAGVGGSPRLPVQPLARRPTTTADDRTCHGEER